MDIDVKIYINNFIKFFNENPNELASIIGQSSPDQFFKEVESVAYLNHEQGEDVELTRKQIIDIIVKLNKIQPDQKKSIKKTIEPFIETSYGKIFLN